MLEFPCGKERSCASRRRCGIGTQRGLRRSGSRPAEPGSGCAGACSGPASLPLRTRALRGRARPREDQVPAEQPPRCAGTGADRLRREHRGGSARADSRAAAGALSRGRVLRGSRPGPQTRHPRRGSARQLLGHRLRLLVQRAPRRRAPQLRARRPLGRRDRRRQCGRGRGPHPGARSRRTAADGRAPGRTRRTGAQPGARRAHGRQTRSLPGQVHHQGTARTRLAALGGGRRRTGRPRTGPRVRGHLGHPRGRTARGRPPQRRCRTRLGGPASARPGPPDPSAVLPAPGGVRRAGRPRRGRTVRADRSGRRRIGAGHRDVRGDRGTAGAAGGRLPGRAAARPAVRRGARDRAAHGRAGPAGRGSRLPGSTWRAGSSADRPE